MLPDLSALAVHDTDDTEGIATNKLIQKRGKAAEKKAAKPIIELPAPGEESEPNSRLQLAPRSRFQAIKALFDNVNPVGLSMGRDQGFTWRYDTLTPVGVYDVIYKDNHAHVQRYKTRRATMSIAPGSCTEFGTAEECVRTDAVLSDLYTDRGLNGLTTLNDKVNEKYLLHGTGIGGVKGIIYGGFEIERVAAAGFGKAIYLAEDPGKANHYAGLSASGANAEPKNLGWQDFNQILGLDTSKYEAEKLIEGVPQGVNPAETYYMLVSRALLGCADHVSNNQMGLGKGTNNIWNKKVYTNYEAAQLQPEYDSIVKEHSVGVRGGFRTGTKFREFLFQRNDSVLPVMLVAYVRRMVGEQAAKDRFDYNKFECDNISPLVHLLQAGTDAQKETAVRTLGQMSLSDAHFDARRPQDTNLRMMQAGVVTPTVALLARGTDSMKRYAAYLLSTMLHWAWKREEAGTRTDARAAMLRANVIPPAIAWFYRSWTETRNGDTLDPGLYPGWQGLDMVTDSRESSSLLILHMVRGKQGRGDGVRVQLVEQGLVPLLLEHVFHAKNTSGQTGNMLMTLEMLVEVPEGAGALFKSGGIPVMMNYFASQQYALVGIHQRALILSVLLKMGRVALSYKDARPLVQIADIDLDKSVTDLTNGIEMLTRELYDTARSVNNDARVREMSNKRPDLAGELLDMIAEISPEYKARVEFRLKADDPNKPTGFRAQGERA